MDEATPGMQPSSNETDGGFRMCKQHVSKAKSDTCGIRRNARPRAWNSGNQSGRSSEVGFVQSASVNREELIIGVTTDAVIKP